MISLTKNKDRKPGHEGEYDYVQPFSRQSSWAARLWHYIQENAILFLLGAPALILIFVFTPLMILTGVAQSPGLTAAMPVLLDLFGGRQSARTLHTIGTVVFVLFVGTHVLQVASAGFINQVRSMITGK